MAGEYLESIGKTDLAVLTEAEWLTLLEVMLPKMDIPPLLKAVTDALEARNSGR